MCQLVRIKPGDPAAFEQALAGIPAETWANAYADNARGEGRWATLAAVDAMREYGVGFTPLETVEAELIPVFFGPGAGVQAKLMAADLRCRALAAGAVGVIRVPEGADPGGETLAWQPPHSPAYTFLLIRRREEAAAAAARLYPGLEAARQWAERFGVGSLEALLAQAKPGIPAKIVPDLV